MHSRGRAFLRRGDARRSAISTTDHAPDDVDDLAPAVEKTTRADFFLIAICGLMSLVDGFDVQAIAFAAPLLTEEFGLSAGTMGTIFSAGLLGGLVGAVPAIHLDLRFGRRRMMLVCLLWFAAGSALTALVTSGTALLIVRFLSGIGLGMAVPLVMGTMTDSLPAHIRARALAIVTCAIPAGGLLGGLLAAAIMPVMGWRVLFVIGAVLPLVLMPPFQKALKNVEHRFTALKTGGIQSVGQTVRFVKDMFSFGGLGLFLLVLTNFFSMLLAFSLMNWTPSLLVQSGREASYSAMAGGILNGGAMFAILVLGYVLDRRGALGTSLTAYGLAALSLVLAATALGGGTTTLVVIAIAGFFGVGAQLCVTYMIAHSVKADQRVAILGVSMIASRSGGAVGPLLFGLLIQLGWTPPAMFVFSAGLAIVVIVGLAVSDRTLRRPQE